jgi:hypothetical protein
VADRVGRKRRKKKKKPRDGSTRLSSLALPESHVILVQGKEGSTNLSRLFLVLHKKEEDEGPASYSLPREDFIF